MSAFGWIDRSIKKTTGELGGERIAGLRFFYLDGLFSSFSDNLIAGFLELFLLSYGMSNGIIGLNTSIANLCGAVSIIPGAMAISRVKSRKRLVVLTDREPGTPAWYLDQWAFTFENPWSATKASEISCALDRGVATNSLFTMNQFVSNPFPTPEDSLAVNSNPFFLETAQTCQAERSHLPNFLSVNFYDLGDLFAVVRTLNGLDESPAP